LPAVSIRETRLIILDRDERRGNGAMSEHCGESMTADRTVGNETEHAIAFPIRYARWIQRIGTALTCEGSRIASERTQDLAAFDRHVESMVLEIAQYRRNCEAIIATRKRNP
jgi:hypothetical protein